MKNFENFKSDQSFALSKDEMLNVKGGGFYCTSSNGLSFSTDSAEVGYAWADFWDTAGYEVNCSRTLLV